MRLSWRQEYGGRQYGRRAIGDEKYYLGIGMGVGIATAIIALSCFTPGEKRSMTKWETL